MIPVTIDTTTLASGFVRPDRPPGQVLAAWFDRAISLVTSDPLIDELEDALAKPYFARALSPERRQRSIALVRSRATIVPVTVAVHGIASHPEDDVVLATALSGGAQFLITSDHDLLGLGEYEGLYIVSAAQFLSTLPGLTP
jgi:uncharacterized protein